MVVKISKSTFKKIAFSFSVFLFGLIFLYGGYLNSRSRVLYKKTKEGSRGWSGRVHKSDPVLGFVPIPGAMGAHIFPVGPDIDMKYGENGFRVPANDAPVEYQRPLILALGCSFTYGDACRAEDTYLYKTAKGLGGSGLNAGICSYGLAQILIRSRTLIPESKADYVIVQYSPWLVDRALSYFAPVYYAHLPAPYFSDAENGEFKIVKPVFETANFSVNLDLFRKSESGFSDYVSFIFKCGIPLFFRDDLEFMSYRIKSLTGLVPLPTKRKNELTGDIYREIRNICEENGSKMLVVVLGNSVEPVVVPETLKELDIVIIDAHAELLSRLDEKTEEEFYKAYAHYRGDPPVLVDRHPNPHAHDIIAEAILKVILNAN